MVQIFVDSTADLGAELTRRYRIEVIPLYVHLAEKTHIDGVDIGIQDLFRFVDSTGMLPKTSAPSVADFRRFFDRPGEIVFLGISSQLSATVQNAMLAAKEFPPGKIEVIDSLNLSTGIGLLAIKAAELRDQDLSASEIARQVRGLVPKVRTNIVLETLEYVYKGGRCSAVQNLMGGLLHIRPVLIVRQDGTIQVRGRTRGARLKALQFLLDDVADNLDQIDLTRVFISHTGCDEDVEFLKQELLNIAPVQEVLTTLAGSVIASHGGPGTIGVLYMLK